MPWCLVPSSNIGWSPSSGARKIIYGKNRVNFLAQSELRISGNLRNHEGPDLGNAKQKRIEREIQSRRGSPPPLPWRPLTRGGTLLPSRGRLGKKKKEEGGSLSPPLSRCCRSAAGARIVSAIYINNLATVNTNSLPLYAAV